jgi:hypothetical protein
MNNHNTATIFTIIIIIINRPDIIIKNKKDKICLLIDVAVPSDRNVIQKESKKKLRYKNLSVEIQRMLNMKCFVIPVIIGATGIVTKGLQKYLETIPGKHFLYKKKAVLGTSHIIRKVLQSETLSLGGGVHHWFKRKSTRKNLWKEKRK